MKKYGRTRSLSEEQVNLQRQRTNTFKYVYCDYDISQFDSTQKPTQDSDMTSVDMHSVTIVKDERWYDKSSAAYFTSNATRNAQTVSFNQR